MPGLLMEVLLEKAAQESKSPQKKKPRRLSDLEDKLLGNNDRLRSCACFPSATAPRLPSTAAP